MQFALLLLLALLIGVTLGAVGGGGSILAVPVLVGVAGLGVTDATTASLIVVGSAATIGLLAALRTGQVRLGTGTAFGLAGIGGAAVGTVLNRGLSDGVLLVAFAVLMGVVGAKMLHGLLAGRHVRPLAGSERPFTSGKRPLAGSERGAVSLSRSTPRHRGADGRPAGATTDPAPAPLPHSTPSVTAGTVVRILLAGTAVGLLTGLFGVGGGFVIVPALMFLLGLEVRSATATSLLVIALNSGVALAMRADVGSVDWSVVAPFTALAVAGVLLGRSVAGRLRTTTLTGVLTALVIAMAIWTAAQGLGELL